MPFKMFGEVDAWRIKTVLVGLLAVAVSAGKPLRLVSASLDGIFPSKLSETHSYVV